MKAGLIEYSSILCLDSTTVDPSQSPLFENLPLYKKLKVFACLHSGLESASFLTAILPGMERLKLTDPTFDLQAFCFYNFPDEEEEAYLEHKLNAVAPHIPVKCFGNFLYEFSCKAIQNRKQTTWPNKSLYGTICYMTMDNEPLGHHGDQRYQIGHGDT